MLASLANLFDFCNTQKVEFGNANQDEIFLIEAQRFIFVSKIYEAI